MSHHPLGRLRPLLLLRHPCALRPRQPALPIWLAGQRRAPLCASRSAKQGQEPPSSLPPIEGALRTLEASARPSKEAFTDLLKLLFPGSGEKIRGDLDPASPDDLRQVAGFLSKFADDRS